MTAADLIVASVMLMTVFCVLLAVLIFRVVWMVLWMNIPATF